MSIAITEFGNGFVKSANAFGELPVIRTILNRQEKNAEDVNRVSQRALDEMVAPPTGGLKLSCCGSIGGVISGIALGGLITAIASVELWGTGAGLWVEGEKHDCGGCVLAGRILSLYIAIPIIAIGGAVGGIYGGISGAVLCSDG